MILPDANLLLYAYDTESPFHLRSKQWWSDCLSGTEPVLFCPLVVFAFIRISTNLRAYMHPLRVEEATAHVQTWLKQPMAEWVDMQTQDVQEALRILLETKTGGTLTTDAQIAALAVRTGAIIHTADLDFARFRGVQWCNPLTVN